MSNFFLLLSLTFLIVGCDDLSSIFDKKTKYRSFKTTFSKDKSNNSDNTGNTDEDTTSDEEVIPLTASFESLKVHLFDKSCMPCHSASNAKGGFDYETPELASRDALDGLWSIEDGFMPPRRSNKPKPSEEVINAYREWTVLIGAE